MPVNSSTTTNNHVHPERYKPPWAFLETGPLAIEIRAQMLGSRCDISMRSRDDTRRNARIGLQSSQRIVDG